MTAFERLVAIDACRAACRTTALRTDDEAARVKQRGREAALALGYEFPEDVVEAARRSIARGLSPYQG